MARTDADRQLVETACGSVRARRRHLPLARPAAFACLVFAAVLATNVVHAQTPQGDRRWDAWLGCWSTTQNGLTSAAARVCVVPGSSASAVDIVTIASGRVTSREHIEANGERRASQRDGCTGWETARWSADGRRVYVKSEHQCAAGATRTSDGLIAITPQGDWLDVISVTVAANTGVRALRHRPTVEPTDLPAELAATLRTVAPTRIRERSHHRGRPDQHSRYRGGLPSGQRRGRRGVAERYPSGVRDRCEEAHRACGRQGARPCH